MLSEQEMTEIRQRAGKATPGPWYGDCNDWPFLNEDGRCFPFVRSQPEHGHDNGVSPPVCRMGPEEGPSPDFPGYPNSEADAAFIAAARADVPRLLDALTEAYALLARFAHDSDAYRLGREAERKDILDYVREQERECHVTAQSAGNDLAREAAGNHRSMCRHLIAWLKGRDETVTLPGVWQQAQPSPDTHTPSP